MTTTGTSEEKRFEIIRGSTQQFNQVPLGNCNICGEVISDWRDVSIQNRELVHIQHQPFGPSPKPYNES